jgi:protein-S-isoprenylcysteine O-methyltransferase Ste14
LGWLMQLPPGLRIAAGVAVALVGIIILVLGARGLQRHATNVNPYQPSLAIVTDGIYARTRNPIYVGGIAAAVGIAVALALDWVLLLHLLGLPTLHYGVVLHEERYLERKFGEAYCAYKAAVRRYI